MQEYTFNFNYEVTNNSPSDRAITGFFILCDTAEYGYFVEGSYTLALKDDQSADPQTRSESNSAGTTLNALEFHMTPFVIPQGATAVLNTVVVTKRPLEPMTATLPPNWAALSFNPLGEGRLGLYLEALPTGGGWGSGGGSSSGGGGYSGPNDPADIKGMVYESISTGHGVYATMTRWEFPPVFGLKILIPPPAPPQLFYPTTYGPNYEGETSGLLLTPATVMGVVDEDTGEVKDIEVAGVKIKLSSPDISSNVAVGILPFKDG